MRETGESITTRERRSFQHACCGRRGARLPREQVLLALAAANDLVDALSLITVTYSRARRRFSISFACLIYSRVAFHAARSRGVAVSKEDTCTWMSESLELKGTLKKRIFRYDRPRQWISSLSHACLVGRVKLIAHKQRFLHVEMHGAISGTLGGSICMLCSSLRYFAR